MKIFISSMIHSEWYEIKDLIAGGFQSNSYVPDPPTEDFRELGEAVDAAARAGFFTPDQIILLAGSDSRVEAEFKSRAQRASDLGVDE